MVLAVPEAAIVAEFCRFFNLSVGVRGYEGKNTAQQLRVLSSGTANSLTGREILMRAKDHLSMLPPCDMPPYRKHSGFSSARLLGLRWFCV